MGSQQLGALEGTGHVSQPERARTQSAFIRPVYNADRTKGEVVHSGQAFLPARNT